MDFIFLTDYNTSINILLVFFDGGDYMQQILTDALSNAFLALLTLVGAYGLYLVKIAVAYLKDKIKSNRFNAALEQIDKLAEVTVKSIEQTTANELRQAVKDGVVSKEELQNLASRAFAQVAQKLQPEYLKLLEESIANVEGYITDVIEQKVLELKKGVI